MFGFIKACVTLVAMALLLALAAGIAISNTGEATLALWPLDTRLNMPLWLVILGSFVIGLILGAVLMTAPLIRGKWHQRRLRAKIRKLETAAEDNAGGNAAGNNPRIGDG